MIKTDVCIIGAGPAGASTALMLSQLKIPHYIIDKANFPRDKTCGDGLILYAFKALKELQLLDIFFKNPKFIHSNKINLHVSNNVNLPIEEATNRPIFISYGKRWDFDYFLVNQFSEEFTTELFGNGVKNLEELQDGILITLKDDTKILSKIVVGADGINSIVSRKLGKNKPDKLKSSTFISSYFKNVENLPKNNQGEIRICYHKIPLFFYIFPLIDNQVNVSLGGNTKQLLDNNINLIDEVAKIIQTHPKVAYKFKNASQVGNWRGWGIPYHFGVQKKSGNRFMLVGDAAGLANAFYKEGVGTGMMSGIICAKQIANCLGKDRFTANFLETYDISLKKEFGKLLSFSEFALKLTRKRSLFIFLARILKKKFEKRIKPLMLRRSY